MDNSWILHTIVSSLHHAKQDVLDAIISAEFNGIRDEDCSAYIHLNAVSLEICNAPGIADGDISVSNTLLFSFA